MKRICFLIASLFLVAVVQFPAKSQPKGVAVGDRVKISAPTVKSQNMVGTIIGLSTSALSLSSGEQNIVIPFGLIEDMSVSQGKKKNTFKGIRTGILVGLGVGVGGGYLYADNWADNCADDNKGVLNCSLSAWNQYLKFAGISTLVGGILGIIIGSQEVDVWEPVSLKVSMSPPPSQVDVFDFAPTVSLRLSLN